ncbi:hypothetical protein [Leucobacter sp. NPDC077196]|uniref:hypothetical protein n=1 Tax=Leucobacter sp. NPDC077196 TaxID=3154959 RepID=UPI0034407A11
MRSTRRITHEDVALAARNLTTEEIVRYAAQFRELGENAVTAEQRADATALAQMYEDAVSIHARELSWGEIIRLSMTDWKEDPHADDTTPGLEPHSRLHADQRIRAVAPRDR